MNFLDILFIAILIIFSFSGYRSGIIAKATTVISIIAGAYFAFKFSHVLIPHLTIYLKDGAAALMASYVILFILVLFLGSFLGKIIKKIFVFIFPPGLDGIFGAILGLIEGYIIVLLMIFVLNLLASNPQFLSDSKIANFSRPILIKIERLAPSNIRRAFDYIPKPEQPIF